MAVAEPATLPAPVPVKPATVAFVFDGRGGVERLPEGGAVPPIPAKGFVLVSGHVRSPQFVEWLRAEIGVFNYDLMTGPTSRSRCTVLDDKAIVGLRVFRPGKDDEDGGRQLLSIWLEKGRAIVVSELNMPDFLNIDHWKRSRHAPTTPADLVARLGLRAADRLEPLIELLGDRLDRVEESLIALRPKDARARLADLRRTLISFRRLVLPLRDVLNTLEIEDLSFLLTRDRVRLREAAARNARLAEELQALSERAVLVHEQILDTRAEQMNRTILVLTAVTVVFMPLTVISGVLGMNLPIPFADRWWSFPAVAGGLVLTAVSIVAWMKFKRWL